MYSADKAAATVPKLTVVVRKAYGAGYYVMCGRAYEPDLLVAWPGAEISVMGAEGMLSIASLKLGGTQNMPTDMREQMLGTIRERIQRSKTLLTIGEVRDLGPGGDRRMVLG